MKSSSPSKQKSWQELWSLPFRNDHSQLKVFNMSHLQIDIPYRRQPSRIMSDRFVPRLNHNHKSLPKPLYPQKRQTRCWTFAARKKPESSKAPPSISSFDGVSWYPVIEGWILTNTPIPWEWDSSISSLVVKDQGSRRARGWMGGGGWVGEVHSR